MLAGHVAPASCWRPSLSCVRPNHRRSPTRRACLSKKSPLPGLPRFLCHHLSAPLRPPLPAVREQTIATHRISRGCTVGGDESPRATWPQQRSEVKRCCRNRCPLSLWAETKLSLFFIIEYIGSRIGATPWVLAQQSTIHSGPICTVHKWAHMCCAQVGPTCTFLAVHKWPTHCSQVGPHAPFTSGPHTTLFSTVREGFFYPFQYKSVFCFFKRKNSQYLLSNI